jgi:hypothetical protein
MACLLGCCAVYRSLVEVYRRFRGSCCLHHLSVDPLSWHTSRRAFLNSYYRWTAQLSTRSSKLICLPRGAYSSWETWTAQFSQFLTPSVRCLVGFLEQGIGLLQSLCLHRAAQHGRTQTYAHACVGFESTSPLFERSSASKLINVTKWGKKLTEGLNFESLFHLLWDMGQEETSYVNRIFLFYANNRLLLPRQFLIIKIQLTTWRHLFWFQKYNPQNIWARIQADGTAYDSWFTKDGVWYRVHTISAWSRFTATQSRMISANVPKIH